MFAEHFRVFSVYKSVVPQGVEVLDLNILTLTPYAPLTYTLCVLFTVLPDEKP